MSECELRRFLLDQGFECDRERCIFWDSLGLDGEPQCALVHFRLLGEHGRELAEWLLSLKERTDALEILGLADHEGVWPVSADTPDEERVPKLETATGPDS